MSNEGKPYTAYLIDPFARTVTAVEGVNGDIDWIYVAMQVNGFEGAYSEDESLPSLLCDDEGLWRDPQGWFRITGKQDPIGGRAIASDTDDEGYSITPRMSLEEFAKHIDFGVPVGLGGGSYMWVSEKRP